MHLCSDEKSKCEKVIFRGALIYNLPQNYYGENGKPYVGYENAYRKIKFLINANSNRPASISGVNIAFA
jgi:hypothetical protein